MTALLNLIYCFLLDMILSFVDAGKTAWDSLLSPADSILASLGTGSLSVPVIPTEYTWVLGATGMSQAVAIIASALMVRFTLQSIPFVRWGS